MALQKFSLDPKVKLVTINQFCFELIEIFKYRNMNTSEWQDDVVSWFDENEKIENLDAVQGNVWYEPSRLLFDDKYLMLINFRTTCDYYTHKEKIILDSIIIALRDGFTEYHLIDEDEIIKKRKKISSYKYAKRRERLNAELDEYIWCSKFINKNLPTYFENTSNKKECLYQNFIKNDLYVTPYASLMKEFVVLDLETNGLRTKNDDLLSLTIYDPDTGRAYDRRLPLELQPIVLTKWIHGLGEKEVNQYESITQKEFDQLVFDFNLENKVILTYSNFDYKVLCNYFKRHKISGFEKLRFFNIKDCFDFLSWRVEKSKDNLCKLFGIAGVTDIHSSLNDCVLEWKLFECYRTMNWVIISSGSKCSLYEYCEGYIVPVTYISDRFIKVANLNIPPMDHTLEKVFDLTIGGNQIKKFDTNINGMAFEHMLNCAIKAIPQDNSEFLIKNNEKLKFINELYSEIVRQISVTPSEDGVFKTDDAEFQELVEEVNSAYKTIEKKCQGLISFVKQDVFEGKSILTQELVITDNKILAKCDLSTENAVLEIKTGNVFENDEKTKLKEHVARQIYYQKRKRSSYLLSLQFVLTQNGTVKNLLVEIYKVHFVQE